MSDVTVYHNRLRHPAQYKPKATLNKRRQSDDTG